MDIRPESPADADRIAEVVRAAFDGRPNEPRLVELIRASERYVPELALVAEQDNTIVGHVMFSFVSLKGADEFEVLQLAPVSVVPEWQRRGIGGALIREGIKRASARHEPLILVQGHAAYYPRFGFEPSRDYNIEPPSPEIPAPFFMVLRLSAYEERYRGQVIYPPAFDDPQPEGQKQVSSDLNGKRVLVIGGETALGGSLAVGLAKAGAEVAIASLSSGTKAEFAVNSVLNQLWAMNRQSVALVIDAADAAQVREAASRAGRELGRLDLAAAVAPDDEAGLALDALRAALGERPVVSLAQDTSPEDALRAVTERL